MNYPFETAIENRNTRNHNANFLVFGIVRK